MISILVPPRSMPMRNMVPLARGASVHLAQVNERAARGAECQPPVGILAIGWRTAAIGRCGPTAAQPRQIGPGRGHTCTYAVRVPACGAQIDREVNTTQ